jgi:hypothetical protein
VPARRSSRNLSIIIDAAIASLIESRAELEGVSVSDWLSDAALREIAASDLILRTEATRERTDSGQREGPGGYSTTPLLHESQAVIEAAVVRSTGNLPELFTEESTPTPHVPPARRVKFTTTLPVSLIVRLYDHGLAQLERTGTKCDQWQHLDAALANWIPTGPDEVRTHAGPWTTVSTTVRQETRTALKIKKEQFKLTGAPPQTRQVHATALTNYLARLAVPPSERASGRSGWPRRNRQDDSGAEGSALPPV